MDRVDCWGDVGWIVRIHILAIIWPAPFLYLHFCHKSVHFLWQIFKVTFVWMCRRLWISYTLHSSSFFLNNIPLACSWILTKIANEWLAGWLSVYRVLLNKIWLLLLIKSYSQFHSQCSLSFLQACLIFSRHVTILLLLLTMSKTM